MRGRKPRATISKAKYTAEERAQIARMNLEEVRRLRAEARSKGEVYVPKTPRRVKPTKAQITAIRSQAAAKAWVKRREVKEIIHKAASGIVNTVVTAVESGEITVKEGTIAARKLKAHAIEELQMLAQDATDSESLGLLNAVWDAYIKEEKSVIDHLDDNIAHELPEQTERESTMSDLKELIGEVGNKPEAQLIGDIDSWYFARRGNFTVSGARDLREYYEAFLDASGVAATSNSMPKMVKMRFEDPGGNILFASIGPKYTKSYELFSNQIDKLLSKQWTGSDRFDDTYEPDLTYMEIYYNTNPEGMYNKVDKDYFMFASQPEESYTRTTDSLCIWNAVFGTDPGTQSPLAGKYDESKPINKKEKDLIAFNVKLVELYQHSLRVYYDYPLGNIDLTNLVESVAPNGEELYKIPKVTALRYRDFGEKTNRVNIVYCNNHVEPYRGVRNCDFWYDTKMNISRFRFKLNDDPNRVGKWEKITVNRLKLAKRAGVSNDGKDANIVFDLETVYDPVTEKLMPYSISFLDGSDIGFKLSEPTDNTRKPTRMFLEHLCDRQAERKYTLIGYNSSRFDNQFLIKDMMDMDILQSVFYQNGSILNIKWGGRHTVHDICRYTALSLDDCCEAMKTTYKKQTGTISHKDVQAYYAEHGEVFGFFHDAGCENRHDGIQYFKLPTDRSQAAVEASIKRDIGCECKKYYDLVLYNTFDVLATGEIYSKVEKALTETKTIPSGKTLSDHKTIGGLIFKKFKSDLRDLRESCVEIRDPRIKHVVQPLIERDRDEARGKAFLKMLIEPMQKRDRKLYTWLYQDKDNEHPRNEVLEYAYDPVKHADAVIVQVEERGRKIGYMMFENIAQYQHAYPLGSEYCTHEVILGHKPQRPKFDIDGGSLEIYKQIVDAIRAMYLKQYGQVLCLTVCDSSGFDTLKGVQKFSRHMIGMNHVFANSTEAKYFTQLVIDSLPADIAKHLDNCNGKTQHFRTAGSSRNGRRLEILGDHQFCETIVGCGRDTMFGWELPMLPCIAPGKQGTVVQSSLNTEDVKQVIAVVEKDKSLKFDRVTLKNMIVFKRVGAAHCEGCGRVHDGARGAAGWMWGGCVWRKCFNSGKAIKLDGEVESSDEDRKSKGVVLPLFDDEEYQRVRSSLFAGRTQCFGGPSSLMSEEMLNILRMIDVASMYPYVMTTRDFPCGEITAPGEVSYEACIAAGRIGFYDCVINQSKLKWNLIPLRGETLNWEYKGDITLQRLNTIDLQEVQKRGCVVSIGDGVCFTGKISGRDLFKCILKFKAIKMNEDLLKATKDPKCNPGMRKVAKDCMNCLSGKVIENLHLDKHELVRTLAHYEKILSKASSTYDARGNLSSVVYWPSEIFDNKAAIVSYEVDRDAVFKKDNRPIYLGICIYAYARSHLYNTVLENYNPIYCDTDSALIKYEDFKRFEADQPALCGWLNPVDSKTGLQTLVDFGQYTEEDGSENMVGYTCIAPKNYFIYGKATTPKGMKNHPDLVKKGFKGVNPSADRFIADPSLYLDAFIKHPTRDEYRVHDQHATFELYHSDKLPKIQQAPHEFVDKIKSQGYAFVLCSSLQKTTRNTREQIIDGVTVPGKRQAGGIYQRWVVKKISARLDDPKK